MTKQTKYFIELSDIVAVRLECKSCTGSVLIPLRKNGKLPYTCPNCTVTWWDDPDSLALKAVGDLMASIKQINPLMEKQKVTFSLEVNLPEDENAK